MLEEDCSTPPSDDAPAGPGSRGSRSWRARHRVAPLGVAGVAAVVMLSGVVYLAPQGVGDPAGQAVAGGTTGSEAAGGTVPGGTPSPTAVPPPAVPAVVQVDGPPGGGDGWTRVFGDEFDGAVIDRGTWRVNRYGGRGDDGAFNPSAEGAYYSPANVGVENGCAYLEIRPDPAVVEGTSYTHSSGMLSSQGALELEDGDYVEARVWIPSGDGLWPAFWTLPDDRWPPETDIFELFDTSIQDRPTFVYHFPDEPGVAGRRTGAVYGAPTTDYRDSWHTYGMARSNGVLVPYVDGVAYPDQGVPAGADALPQFLVLNLAVYAGKQPVAGTRMLIDWVRVWHPAGPG